MSEFTSPLVLMMLPRRQWSVHEKFEYHVGQVGSGIVIRVPKGFKTDLASIPRIVWSILRNTRYINFSTFLAYNSV